MELLKSMFSQNVDGIERYMLMSPNRILLEYGTLKWGRKDAASCHRCGHTIERKRWYQELTTHESDLPLQLWENSLRFQQFPQLTEHNRAWTLTDRTAFAFKSSSQIRSRLLYGGRSKLYPRNSRKHRVVTSILYSTGTSASTAKARDGRTRYVESWHCCTMMFQSTNNCGVWLDDPDSAFCV